MGISGSLVRRYFLIISILCSVCPTVFASLPPTAVISADVTSGITPLTVNFNAGGSFADTGRTIVKYRWQFGDGGLAGGPAVSCTYSFYGVFTATLEVIDDAGLSDIETITINVRYSSIFTAADINNDGSIDLADFSVLASQWLKAPGKTSADIDQSTASKGIIDLADLLKLSVNWLFENDQPTAVINYNDPNIPAGETVIFGSYSSFDLQPFMLQYLWDFGDGTPVVTTSNKMVTHVFALAGSYTVKLRVSDGDLSADTQIIVPVNPAVGGGGSMELSSTSLDFGPLYRSATWGQRAFSNEKFIELTNNGPGTMTITGMWSTNPSVFKIISGSAGTSLAPGEKYFISVKFEPRSLATDPLPPLGPWTGDLAIVTTGGVQIVPLSGSTVGIEAVSGISSAVLMGYNYASPTSNPIASVKSLGVTESETYIVFASIGNQGSVNMTFSSVEIAGADSAHFSAQILSQATLYLKPFSVGDKNALSLNTSGLNPYPPSGGIKLIFKPRITEPTARKLTAKAIIHTSGGDLEIALIGTALYKSKLKIDKASDFEFNRINPGKSTSILGSDVGSWFEYPAEITVSNVGTAPVSISMAMLDVSAGGASKFSFSPFGTMTLGLANPSVVLTGTFAPNVKGHHSAVLVITPGDQNYPTDYTLLHGVANGTAVYPLGTTEPWYTVDDWYFYDNDYSYAKVIEFKSTGAAAFFGDLYEIQDPFMVQDPYNHVYVEQWYYSQNSLVMYDGTEYAIDSYVFGPYTPGYSENTAATEARLAAGETIGSGGILKTRDFINDTDGNIDILNEGPMPLLIDITPDGTIFYTESLVESGITRTRLKWLNGASGGIITEDLSVLLTGQPDNEPIMLRAIAGSSYRLFVSFWPNTYDIDISSSHVITATKNLTGLLSEAPDDYSRIDGSGKLVTVDSDVPGHIQVFKEDLHNGGRTLFAQATVPLPDVATDCLVDKLGNVFVQTAYGIYQFSPAGAAMNYMLSGSYFYSNNQIGQNPDGEKNAEWYMDFSLLWFNR